MKFTAALIATAAAVKTHDDQWDADLSELFDLPTLTAAADALAHTAVVDETVIADIAALSPEEAVDLALWCTIKEDACASNFEEVVGQVCMGDEDAP